MMLCNDEGMPFRSRVTVGSPLCRKYVISSNTRITTEALKESNHKIKMRGNVRING